MYAQRLKGAATPVMRAVEITPEIAADMLSRNHGNRRMSESRVLRYASDMRGQKWRLTHQGIAFDGTMEDGELLDGQNRLNAVIRVGFPVEMMVVEHADPETFADIDTGKVRNLSDLLTIEGARNSDNIAACVNWVWRLKHRTPQGVPASGAPPPRVGLELYRRESAQALRHAVNVTERLRKAIHVPPGPYAGLYYTCAQLDFGDAEDFWERLRVGENLQRNDPVLRLREFIIKDRTQVMRVRANALYHIAVTTKAWNAYRRNAPITNLRYRQGGDRPEEFPIPI